MSSKKMLVESSIDYMPVTGKITDVLITIEIHMVGSGNYLDCMLEAELLLDAKCASLVEQKHIRNITGRYKLFDHDNTSILASWQSNDEEYKLSERRGKL